MRERHTQLTAETRVLLAREEPARELHTAAAPAGRDPSPGWGRSYPHVQMVTIAERLRGATIQMPAAHGTFAQAQWATTQAVQQGMLGLE